MSSKESEFERRLRAAMQQGQAEAEAARTPEFGDVFAAAEATAGRRRGRVMAVGGVAAALALFAIAVVLQLQPVEQDWQFVDPDDFASSTSWSAPSDVLLPEHRFDIYGEIPVLIESTESSEGALL